MMKRMMPCLLMIAACLPVCGGSIVDEPETIDGYLTQGEYLGGIMDIFLYDNSRLLYLGGITQEITVRDDAAAILIRRNSYRDYHLSPCQLVKRSYDLLSERLSEKHERH